MSDLQFFPTPRWLAKRMWSKFKNQNFVRVLDPEAGAGDLADAMPDAYERRGTIIDCIEIDASKHPLLREKGLRVVGLDFLNFEGGACYSHVVMNPPFAEGAKHVLKAWQMLFHGEVCAIINAETLRNPFSAERRQLAAIVEEHGEVEYHKDAFKGEGVAREANVEIALVHLIKPAECSHDWIGPVIASMTTDQIKEEALELPRELALPNSFVFNQVTAFRMAVKAMREAVRMEAVAQHFAVRIGLTMEDLANNRGEEGPVGEMIRERLEKEYHDLKDRAWASVLRSTEALSKLSRKVQKQAESQFELIKTLEFNESNVYGFLLGLVQSQPEMQLDMACDVFDQITKYHSENTVYYRGWKSNDKHRTMGIRIKMTRFVLPGHKVWCNSIEYDSIRMLADFDKVFALLDGKSAPEVSLVSLFDPSRAGGLDPHSFSRLCRGERLTSTYFDCRYHPGVGSIHFFPKKKDVVDRLNRIVGRRRGWLPPPTEPVTDAFWLQYDSAEKLDREVRDEANKGARAGRVGSHFSTWDHPINQFMRNDADASKAGEAMLAKAMDTVLARHGMLEALEHSQPAEQLLLAA